MGAGPPQIQVIPSLPISGLTFDSQAVFYNPVRLILWGWLMTYQKDFDPKCLDLAEVFLEDEPAINTDRICDELAIVIQLAIENFIAAKIAELIEDEAQPTLYIVRSEHDDNGNHY